MAYLLSLPDNWTFIFSELALHAADGEQSFRSGLKELKEYGYLRIEARMESNGRMNGHDWIIDERPDQQPEVKLSEVVCHRNAENAKFGGLATTNTDSKEELLEEDLLREKADGKQTIPQKPSPQNPNLVSGAERREMDPAASPRRQKAKYEAESHPVPKDALKPIWSEFCAHRKEMGHPLTELACRKLWKSAEGHTVEWIIQCFDRAIVQGWRAPYFNSRAQVPQPQQPETDYEAELRKLEAN